MQTSWRTSVISSVQDRHWQQTLWAEVSSFQYHAIGPDLFRYTNKVCGHVEPKFQGYYPSFITDFVMPLQVQISQWFALWF